MTEQEYKELQERFSKKLDGQIFGGWKIVQAYKDGILSCKSILKNYFENKNGRSQK